MNILVINCGSSTVKARLLHTGTDCLMGKGLVDRVGTAEAALKWEVGEVTTLESLPNCAVEDATNRLIKLASELARIEGVGHRVVHGGELFTQPILIDDAVLDGIERCSVFAPLHNPAHAAGIRAARAALPDVPHVAVFDTAFHSTMPRRAYRYAIPEVMYREFGIRRYGMHGTSHQYISGKANEWLQENGFGRPFRVCTLHLGNGCSMAAVLDGVCQDTSMGFTPLAGLVMGTRCGDIDPAVVPFLMDRKGWNPTRADHFMNKECGLLGVSGQSSDMRDIERARREGNEKAALAFDLFCYRIIQYVGVYLATLGGLDALVFSGGIGEHSQAVRDAVISDLRWLGVELDEDANAAPAGEITRISRPGNRPAALVIRTDEERLIAHQTEALARTST